MRGDLSDMDAHSVGLKRALAIQFFSKYASVIIQLVLTALLARLLSPEQYGVVAIVTIFKSFFAILADVGLTPAIVQFDDLDDNDISGLFTFSVVLGLVLAAVFCLLAYPVAWFYSEESLVVLCWVASLSILFNASNMVPNGLLLKAKRFANIGIRLIVVTVISGFVAVAMALNGCGALSLVVQSVVSSLCVFVWNFVGSGIIVGNRHFMNNVDRDDVWGDIWCGHWRLGGLLPPHRFDTLFSDI